jgi:serine/threonine protein kinase
MHLDNPDDANPDEYYYNDDADTFDRTDHFFHAHEFIASKCHLDVLDGQECNIFHGSIDIDKGSDLLYEVGGLRNVLSHLTRITGFVSIFQTPFKSLDFLHNVESISECGQTDASGTDDVAAAAAAPVPGCQKWNFASQRYALKVEENFGMTRLGLRRLRKVAGGSFESAAATNSPIMVKDNLQLCFINTIEWSIITGGLLLPAGRREGDCTAPVSSSVPCQFGFSANYLTSERITSSLEGLSASAKERFRTEAVAPGCDVEVCDPICAGRGCWDGGRSSCQLCREPAAVLRNGGCVVGGGCEAGNPSPGFYPDPIQSGLCRPCHPTCDDCTGLREDECTICIVGLVRQTDSTCASACPRGQYADAARICRACPEECVECTGTSECTVCDVTLRQGYYLSYDVPNDRPLAQCVTALECPAGTYSAAVTAQCTPCEGGCRTCRSSGANACVSCKPGQPHFLAALQRCYDKCPDGYYASFNTTAAGSGVCERCSASCARCVGPANTDCLACASNYNVNSYSSSVNGGNEREEEATGTGTGTGTGTETETETEGSSGDTQPLARLECLALGECGDGKYSDVDTGRCEACGPHCTRCAGIKALGRTYCSKCTAATFLDPTTVACVESCTAIAAVGALSWLGEATPVLAVPAGAGWAAIVRARGGVIDGVVVTVARPFDASAATFANAGAIALRAGIVLVERSAATEPGTAALRAERAGALAVIFVQSASAATEAAFAPEANADGALVTIPVYSVDRHAGLRLSKAARSFAATTATITSVVPAGGVGYYARERFCEQCLSCDVDEFEVEPCTHESDRVCDDCKVATCLDAASQGRCPQCVAAAISPSRAPMVAAAGLGSLFITVAVVAAAVRYRRHKRSLAPHNFGTEVKQLYDTVTGDGRGAAMMRATKLPREIRRTCFTKGGQRLGGGAFGDVWKGWLDESGEPTGGGGGGGGGGAPRYAVAAKQLKEESKDSPEAVAELMEEAALMAQVGRHKHLVSLIGVITSGNPKILLVSFCEHGSLLDYMVERARAGCPLPTGRRLRCGRDIAAGMGFLADNFFIHRDLAARNVLVSAALCCKVADFGLARGTTGADDYYRSRGGAMPIKWTAPEAIEEMKFSFASDVWSFGIVLTEIYNDGTKPYHPMKNQEAFVYFMQGGRARRPAGCSERVYALMLQCWAERPEDRPGFHQIVARMDALTTPWAIVRESLIGGGATGRAVGATGRAVGAMGKSVRLPRPAYLNAISGGGGGDGGAGASPDDGSYEYSDRQRQVPQRQPRPQPGFAPDYSQGAPVLKRPRTVVAAKPLAPVKETRSRADDSRLGYETPTPRSAWNGTGWGLDPPAAYEVALQTLSAAAAAEPSRPVRYSSKTASVNVADAPFSRPGAAPPSPVSSGGANIKPAHSRSVWVDAHGGGGGVLHSQSDTDPAVAGTTKLDLSGQYCKGSNGGGGEGGGGRGGGGSSRLKGRRLSGLPPPNYVSSPAFESPLKPGGDHPA